MHVYFETCINTLTNYLLLKRCGHANEEGLLAQSAQAVAVSLPGSKSASLPC
jgi:hypothetical protein